MKGLVVLKIDKQYLRWTEVPVNNGIYAQL